jgi:hypothetical protein
VPLYEATIREFQPQLNNYSAFELETTAGDCIILKAENEERMLYWLNSVLAEKHATEASIDDIAL